MTIDRRTAERNLTAERKAAMTPYVQCTWYADEPSSIGRCRLAAGHTGDHADYPSAREIAARTAVPRSPMNDKRSDFDVEVVGYEVLTPTWSGVVLGLAAAYPNTAAIAELQRMAELADRYVKIASGPTDPMRPAGTPR